MKFLAASDLHLGRPLSQLPSGVAARHRVAHAWQATVEAAIRHRVDAVLLAGDIVDQQNCFFEALGPLDAGLAELQKAGIATFAVAGNHDVAVLPQLAETMGQGRLTLLGKGGVWECHTLTTEGHDQCQLMGWSFPETVVNRSPLPDLPEPADPSLPCIGLLHADLDASGGNYCPVQRNELEATPMAVWILGHIHKPGRRDTDGSPVILYPGSIQGTDPGIGEQGCHGPWLLTFKERAWEVEQIPVASIQYDLLHIELDGIGDVAALHQKLAAAMRNLAAEITARQPCLQGLSLRLLLNGRTMLPQAEIAATCQELMESGLACGDTDIWLNGFEVTATPPIAVEELARGQGMIAELAGLVRDLEHPGDQPHLQSLCHDLQVQLGTVRNARTFLPLQEGEPDAEACRSLLKEQAGRLLDALLRQGEAADG